MAQNKKNQSNKKRQLEEDEQIIANTEPALKKKKIEQSLNGKEKNGHINGVTHDDNNEEEEDDDDNNNDIDVKKIKQNAKAEKKIDNKNKIKKTPHKIKKNDDENKDENEKNGNVNGNDDDNDNDNDNDNEDEDENPSARKKQSKPTKDDGALQWSSLDVSQNTRQAIEKLGFENMMEIQAKAIPHVLQGKDLAGAAKTGSGKTLSFVIPAVELLAKLNWNKSMGTGVIIIAPTRELAIQIKGVAQNIAEFHRNLRVGMVIGGSSRYSEAQMLKMGCSIVIATPGRLADHLENTTFRFDQLKMLVIDEADHILDIGFEFQMQAILKMIPQDRQTLLFSATLTDKTKDLVTMAFQQKPVFVRASGAAAGPTADRLEQMYAVVPQEKKLPALLTFLRQHKNEKIVVFFSTKAGTKFYERLLNSIGLRVLALYGAMDQNKRTNTFFQFVEAKTGILVATNVASRGLDFPAVHWCIQFDPPINPKEYIHRVGRTARAGLKGEALAFLQPSELAYLDLLKECGLELKKIDIENVDYDSLQSSVESVVSNNYELKSFAEDACRAFVRSYDERARTVFNNNGINRTQAARSFCLDQYPQRDDFNSGDRGNRSGRGGRGGRFGRGDRGDREDRGGRSGRSSFRGGFR